MCGASENVVLYHHEHADGSGPFGKKTREVPVGAILIHIADQVDARWRLGSLTREDYDKMLAWLQERRGSIFDDMSVDVFGKAISYEEVVMMQQQPLEQLIYELLPISQREYSASEIKDIATLFATITDYKSKFTSKHSLGIAQKAETMGKYYGYSAEKVEELYFAGAFHDVGKLVVDKDILEKPDKLTDVEYKHIRTMLITHTRYYRKSRG